MWTLSVAWLTVALTSSSLTAPLDEPVKVTVGHEVPPSQPKHYQHGAFPSENGVLIGDILISPNRNALTDSDIKWPGGRVPYVIDSQYSDEIVAKLTSAMREIERDVNGDVVCVSFTPRTDEDNYIEIYPGSGCHSEIGASHSGAQEVSIGPECVSRGTIVHEFLHVLGLSHEHSRADRDSYINVNMTNVLQNHTLDYAKDDSDTFNTPYDFDSITHYSPYTHAVDPTVPVIKPLPGQAVGVKLGQRMALSSGDVLRIQRMYACQEDTSHIYRPYETDRVLRCDFEDDLCNFTQNPANSFKWTVTRGESGAGPRAGNTNGADAYLAVTQQGQNGTARMSTPILRAGSVCLAFFFFQRGPSFLNVVAWGANFARTVVKSYAGYNYNEWVSATIAVTIDEGVAYRIIFEAQVSSDDVAIDDVYIYKGVCL